MKINLQKNPNFSSLLFTVNKAVEFFLEIFLVTSVEILEELLPLFVKYSIVQKHVYKHLIHKEHNLMTYIKTA
jgi:hypothetical protein